MESDVTYVPMRGGFLYLVAVMDWFSRFVLSWALSVTLELGFCLEELQHALRRGRPEIGAVANRDAQRTMWRLTHVWGV